MLLNICPCRSYEIVRLGQQQLAAGTLIPQLMGNQLEGPQFLWMAGQRFWSCPSQSLHLEHSQILEEQQGFE